MQQMSSQLNNFLMNMAGSVTRQALSREGYQYGTDRNLYQVLGYKRQLDFEDFTESYHRFGIAHRIVSATPKATWGDGFSLSEDEDTQSDTDFEKTWKNIAKTSNALHYFERADRVAGIGEYGILLIGVDDGKGLEEEVTNDAINKSKDDTGLLFLRPVSQKNAAIKSYNKERTSARFGLPNTYLVTLTTGDLNMNESTVEVHHSRVIHIAENKDEDDVFGTPRLRPVFNLLFDLAKVIGATAEVYWKGAYRGMHLNVDPEWALGDVNTSRSEILEELKENLEEYDHGQTRWIRTQGVEVTPLVGEIPNPKHAAGVIIQMISGTTTIPTRILIGSERGELASTQDEVNWNARISERRGQFAEPEIVRRFVDRLIEWEILPTPKDGDYAVVWPSLFKLDDKEQAQKGRFISDALFRYTRQGDLRPQDIVSPKEFRELLGFKGDPPLADGRLTGVPSKKTPSGTAKDDTEFLGPQEGQEGETNMSEGLATKILRYLDKK